MSILEPFMRENEQPLDYLVSDGGYGRILRTISCVGDSLSSGELEIIGEDGTTQYIDRYEISWGQFLARMIGAKVYNFSRGGMTAYGYCQTFADEKDLWNPDYASDAYILALGVNDLLNGFSTIGSLEDIDLSDWRNNKPTFAGYYGQIIQRYKQIRPDAKFFLMTMPRVDSAEQTEQRKQEIEQCKQDHAALLYQMAELFPNTYVMDFNRYAPVYDDAFMKKFYLNGHMNACGYLLTAQMVASYLDYIIRNDTDAFMFAGLK